MPSSKFSILAYLGLKSDKFKSGLRNLGGSTKKSMGGLTGMLASAGPALATAAVAGAAVAGAAVAKFTSESLKKFATFEKGMQEVFTLMPKMTKEMKGKMSADVLELAREMGILPEKVVPALYQAISAGVPPDNVFEFMKTASKASIGGVTSLETAVDGLTSVVNTYGKENLSAAKAADIMFTTVKLGKTTFDELSSSLYNALPTAKSFGIEFGTLSAAVADLTTKGVPTAQAMTQLNAAMNALGAPTTRQRAAMEALTLEADDVKAALKKKPDGLIIAMNMLAEAANGDAEKLRKMVGSTDAVKAILSLTSNEAKGFTEKLEAIGNASGAADEAFKEMDKGVTRSFDKMKAAIESAMIKVGGALAPVLNAITPMIQEIADAFADLPWDEIGKMFKEFADEIKPMFKELATAGKEVMKALLPLFKILFKSQEGQAGVLMKVLVALAKVIVLVMKVVGPILTAFEKWISKSGKLGTMVLMLMNPLTIILVPLWLLATAIIWVVEQIEKVIEWIKEWLSWMGPAQEKLLSFATLWKKLKAAVGEFIDWTLGAIEKYVKAVVAQWKALAGLIIGHFTKMANFIDEKLGWLIDLFKGAAKMIWKVFSFLFPDMAKGMEGMADQAKKSVGKITGVFKDSVSKITGWWKRLRGDVVKETKALQDDVTKIEKEAADERVGMMVDEHDKKIAAAKAANKEMVDEAKKKAAEERVAYENETKAMQAALLAMGSRASAVMKLNAAELREVFKRTGEAGKKVMESYTMSNTKQIEIMRQTLMKLGIDAEKLAGKTNEEIRKMWNETGTQGRKVYGELFALEGKAQDQRSAGSKKTQKEMAEEAARRKKYANMNMKEIMEAEAARKGALKREAAAAKKAAEAQKKAIGGVKDASKLAAEAAREIGPAIAEATPATKEYAEAIAKAANSEENLVKRLKMQIQQGAIRNKNAEWLNKVTTGTMRVMGTQLKQLRYGILYTYRMAQFADLYQKAMNAAGPDLEKLAEVAKALEKSGGKISVELLMRGLKFGSLMESMDASLKSIDYTLKGKFVNQ